MSDQENTTPSPCYEFAFIDYTGKADENDAIQSDVEELDSVILSMVMERPLEAATQCLVTNLFHLFYRRCLQQKSVPLDEDYDFLARYALDKTNHDIATFIDIDATVQGTKLVETAEAKDALKEKMIEFFSDVEKLIEANDLDTSHFYFSREKNYAVFANQTVLFLVVSGMLGATPNVYDVDDTTIAKPMYEDAVASDQNMEIFKTLERDFAYGLKYPSVDLFIDDAFSSKTGLDKKLDIRRINRGMHGTLPYPMEDLSRMIEKYRYSFVETAKPQDRKPLFN